MIKADHLCFCWTLVVKAERDLQKIWFKKPKKPLYFTSLLCFLLKYDPRLLILNPEAAPGCRCDVCMSLQINSEPNLLHSALVPNFGFRPKNNSRSFTSVIFTYYHPRFPLRFHLHWFFPHPPSFLPSFHRLLSSPCVTSFLCLPPYFISLPCSVCLGLSVFFSPSVCVTVPVTGEVIEFLMKLVAADTTSWEWKSKKERERERFCLRGVIFVLHKIFKTPAFILIAAGLCVVTGVCEWSLYQSVYRLRVSDGFNVCVRARSAQRETERARNFGDCVNEERRGEGGWGVGLNPRWMKQPSVILHRSYEMRGGGTCLGGEWTMSGRREKREAVNFQPKWGGTNLLVFSLEILAKQHLMQSLVSSNSLVLPFSTFLLFPVIQAWFFISLLWLHPLVLVPFVLHACTFYLIFSLSFLCLFLLLSSFASSPVSLAVSSSFTSPYLFFAPCSRSSIFVSFSPISFCFSPFLLYSHVQFLFSSLFTLTFPSPLFTFPIPCFSHFLP